MAQATSNGMAQLEFEKPLHALQQQIEELEKAADDGRKDYQQEIKKLRQSHQALLKKTFAKLSAWQTVQLSRHPQRPQARDYIDMFVKDFAELHGDRRYGDDHAIITGFGRIGAYKSMIVAHNKGRDTREKVKANFGCAHPEGYRKALAKMKLAEKFQLPVVCLIDTPGAYPGIGSEQRGVAEAIAVNLREMARLQTPVVCCVIGEGGSGGALGIGIGDRIAMMQYAWYTVISPEGCAAILWKSANNVNNEAAAEQLNLTSADNLRLGIIDEVIEEPLGGAHRDPATAGNTLEQWLIKSIRELKRFKVDNLVSRRMDKFRAMGEYSTTSDVALD